MPNKTFMKIARRTFVLTAGLLLTVSAFGYIFWYKPKLKNRAASHALVLDTKDAADKKEALLRLNKKAEAAKDYITDHGFDDRYCFLMDMRIPSGKNRFFVYNLDEGEVEIAGLVAHGSGIGNSSATPVFSNAPNSYCTSLGKYKIGKSYQGQFGLAYKLYGLDKTNSKAFDRFVVLHAHECIPNSEVAPATICKSWGCPTVSPAFLKKLKSYIDTSSKPVLLWIYY
jgi:L,D-transpeptidase catalytic domain